MSNNKGGVTRLKLSPYPTICKLILKPNLLLFWICLNRLKSFQSLFHAEKHFQGEVGWNVFRETHLCENF